MTMMSRGFVQNMVLCEICRSPVLKGHYRNVDSDGPYCEGDVVVCHGCLYDAVLDEKHLKSILAAAIVGLHEALQIRIKRLKMVRFYTRRECWSIRRHRTILHGQPHYHSLGMASSEGVIGLRRGISYDTALVTMAHELAHIWQFENWPCFGLLEKWQIEGFAEWVAYKVALSRALITEAEGLILNPDPVYGGGVRRVLEYEKLHGREVILSGNILQ